MLLSGWNGVSMNNFGTRVAMVTHILTIGTLVLMAVLRFLIGMDRRNQVGNNIKSGRGYGRTGTTLS